MEGIYRLPMIKDYWPAEEGLCIPIIQKGMTRPWFWERLQNIHFDANLQNLPPRDQDIVSNMIVHGNSDLCLNTYWSILEETCRLNLINRLMSTCTSSRVKIWCVSIWKTSQSSWLLNFGFVVNQSRDVYTSLTCTWEREGTLSLEFVNYKFANEFANIILLVPEGHQLLCLYWKFLQESNAHGRVIRKCLLLNKYNESKP